MKPNPYLRTKWGDWKGLGAERDRQFSDLAARWRLGRETVRLLVKDEPGVVKIRLGKRKALTRYSVPESVARRVHTKLFHPAA